MYCDINTLEVVEHLATILSWILEKGLQIYLVI
jgi:hypothetical protein